MLRAQYADSKLAAAVAQRDLLTRQVEELKPPEPDGTNQGLSSSHASIMCTMFQGSFNMWFWLGDFFAQLFLSVVGWG